MPTLLTNSPSATLISRFFAIWPILGIGGSHGGLITSCVLWALLSASFSVFAETDSLGAPLLFRKSGLAYDEFGPLKDEKGEHLKCQIEMYSHYYRITPGMGMTMMGSENAKKIIEPSFGNGQDPVVFGDWANIFLASLPEFKNGQFVGRELLTAMILSLKTDPSNFLNIMRFRGGQLAEYEVRLLALEDNQSQESPFKLGEKAPALRTDTSRWRYPKHYMYVKCIFELPMS